MNINLIIIIILFIFLAFCSIYLNSIRKKVLCILKKHDIYIYANIYTFKDIKRIYMLCKSNNHIIPTDRFLVINYYIVLFVSVLIYIVFGILILNANW